MWWEVVSQSPAWLALAVFLSGVVVFRVQMCSLVGYLTWALLFEMQVCLSSFVYIVYLPVDWGILCRRGWDFKTRYHGGGLGPQQWSAASLQNQCPLKLLTNFNQPQLFVLLLGLWGKWRCLWLLSPNIYIYIYIYTHTHTYIHTYVCINLHKNVYLYIHTHNFR